MKGIFNRTSVMYGAIILAILLGTVGISMIYQAGTFAKFSLPSSTPPDFVAISLDVPSTLYLSSYLVNFTIYNSGSATTEQYNNLLQENSSGNWTKMSSQIVDSHPERTNKVVTFLITPQHAGVYFLRACADAFLGCDAGVITESDEGNNIIYSKATVLNLTNLTGIRKPDLQVDYFFSPIEPQPEGTNVTMKAYAFNDGNTTAYNFSLELWHYIDKNELFSRLFIESLPAGSTNILNYTWYTSNTTNVTVTHVMKIDVDPTNSVDEWKENNNVVFFNYTLTS